MFWKLAKAILFRIDAETAHRFTVALVRLGIRFRGVPLRIVSGTSSRPDSKPIRVAGLDFRSRVGLAAGFDKDAEMIEGLPSLGFGFAEIGTVTPRPQPGNDRPRLFRDPEGLSLFNRMGFNGLGSSLVRERLSQVRERLPSDFRVGVNIGKNKDTPNESAASDYLLAASAFEGLADYLVVNVSSPNTPGLRALQSAETLKPIIEAVNDKITGWRVRPPLFLKLAPEIGGPDLAPLLAAVETWGVDGFVLTNTLGGNWSNPSLAGGWSGETLRKRSREVLIEARKATRRPIISVGGIMTAEEARVRIEAGADLIQIYSGWIFQGPRFPSKVAKAIESMGRAMPENSVSPKSNR